MRISTQLKRPIIVVCSVHPELTIELTEWLMERNLLRAKRTYPKGEKNLGPLSAQNIVATILAWQEEARIHHSTPEKFIIICDNEPVLRDVQQQLSGLTYYSAKRVEYHLITQAGRVDPRRVGFFILRPLGKEGK